MSNIMIEYTFRRIRSTHAFLLGVTEDLAAEQFNWRPGPQALPIGWHIWHIAPWSDRVQAAFPVRGDTPRRQIWEEEELAQRWGVDSSKIGVLRTGEARRERNNSTLRRQV